MPYTQGTAANIVVGAAALFASEASDTAIPAPSAGTSYKDTVEDAAGWRNLGFTSNGLELQFSPEFGEVQVDQILDVAKLFKSGMTVTLNTSMAEATLENLAFAIAATEGSVATGGATVWDIDGVTTVGTWSTNDVSLDMLSGELGEIPVEKKLIAVGASGGNDKERIYTAFRVLSIESVTASQKRDEASTFDVSFRLLPDNQGRYGQVVDRVIAG